MSPKIYFNQAFKQIKKIELKVNNKYQLRSKINSYQISNEKLDVYQKQRNIDKEKQQRNRK